MSSAFSWRSALALAMLFGAAGSARAENWLNPETPVGRARPAMHVRQFDDPPADLPLDSPAAPKSSAAQPEEVHLQADPAHGEHTIAGDELAELGELFAPMFPGAKASRIYGGADYLLVRANFSQAVAYTAIETDDNDDVHETLVPLDFQHGSSVRAFIGYRIQECGADIRFTYTNFNSDAFAESGPSSNNFDLIFAGQGNLQAKNGKSLTSFGNVDVNTYDLDFNKTVCFGQPPCVDGCCTPCARWEANWTFGVRMANVLHDSGSNVFDRDDHPDGWALNHTKFTGAGPRMGAEFRRYLGPSGISSLYARGSMSLLLGEYSIESTRSTEDVITKEMTTNRVIPVTDIEIGASLCLIPRTRLSAGYLFQVWHDLGQTSEVTFTNLAPYDDANIMSFDGFFFRGEWNF